jgi:ABC-type branched-subunit amino acid transport system ATPase component
VIGRVGAGKSSLLMAILNEMTITKGNISMKKDTQIVYAE